jgi:hypothetical protein
MPVEDYAAESRIVVVSDQHHPAQFVLPQHFSAGRIAQLTG